MRHETDTWEGDQAGSSSSSGPYQWRLTSPHIFTYIACPVLHDVSLLFALLSQAHWCVCTTVQCGELRMLEGHRWFIFGQSSNCISTFLSVRINNAPAQSPSSLPHSLTATVLSV